MNDPTLIADLVRAGVDPELIGRVANAITSTALSLCPRNSADVSAERRREKDRERKREIRGIPQTSADSADASLTKEDSKKEKKERGRATRISADWKPSEVDLQFGLAKGMPRERLETEVEKFRNYWTAKSGNAATKLDWPATWRNWVLSSLERTPGNPPTPPPNAKPAYLTPPPGAESLEDIRRKYLAPPS